MPLGARPYRTDRKRHFGLELPRTPLTRNTNVAFCRALRLAVAYSVRLLPPACIKRRCDKVSSAGLGRSYPRSGGRYYRGLDAYALLWMLYRPNSLRHSEPRPVPLLRPSKGSRGSSRGPPVAGRGSALSGASVIVPVAPNC